MQLSEWLSWARDQVGDVGIGGGAVTLLVAAVKAYGAHLERQNTRAMADAFEKSRAPKAIVAAPPDSEPDQALAFWKDRAEKIQDALNAARDVTIEAERIHGHEVTALRARIRELESELKWATGEVVAKTHALDRCKRREEALAGELKADLRARDAGYTTLPSGPPGARTIPPVPDETTPRPRGLPPMRRRD